MKVSILLKTVANLGDHGMEQLIAHEYDPKETVEELVERLLVEKNIGALSGKEILTPSYGDYIQIRIIKPQGGGTK